MDFIPSLGKKILKERNGGKMDLKTYKVKVKDRIYNVKVLEEQNDRIVVDVDGDTITVLLETQEVETPKETRERIQPKEEKPSASAPVPVKQQTMAPTTGKVIRTNVPGKILSILKNVGDTVKTNETVLTMESMKMEIEIKSPFDGTIKRILVKPNEYVNPGAVLVELE